MTRNPERIDEMLEELEEYWKEHPDLRIGQIIENMKVRAYGRDVIDVFYVEDRTILNELKKANDND